MLCCRGVLGLHLLRRTVLTGYVYVSSFVIEIDCYRVLQLLLALLPQRRAGTGSGMLQRLLLLVLPVAAAASRRTSCEGKRRRRRGTRSVSRIHQAATQFQRRWRRWRRQHGSIEAGQKASVDVQSHRM